MTDGYLYYECEVIEKLKEICPIKIENVKVEAALFYPNYYNTMPIIMDHNIVFTGLDDSCVKTVQFKRSEWKRAFRNNVSVDELVDKIGW